MRMPRQLKVARFRFVFAALRPACCIVTTIVAVCLPVLPSAAAEPSPLGETAKITGRVLNEQGQPVAGVSVDAFAHKQRPTTRSDAAGRFVLEIPHGHLGPLALRAQTDDGSRQGFFQFDNLDDSSPSAKLVMRTARTIEIQVVDGEGRPVDGASVAAMSYWFDKMAAAVSDRAGRAVLRLPADAGLQYVWAAKPDVGLDYVAFRRFDEPASNVYKLPPDHKQPLTLTLDGTRTVTVRVVDQQDAPMAGVVIYPWYFERPKKGDHFNISGVEDFHQTADAQGRAVFRMIPPDNVGAITFWTQLDGHYTPERPTFDPQNKWSEVAARLVALVPVHGKVIFADGRPAANTAVTANGDGYQFDRFREAVRTAADGSFELRVYPDQYYLFSADQDRLAAPAVAQIVRQGHPVRDVQLVLRPATRVYGRLTAGENHQPMAEHYLTLYQSYAEQYHTLAPAEKLPNPLASNKAVGPLIGRNAKTNAKGEFEFFVPPGNYYIIGPETVEPPKFEITDQTELEVNLHADRLDRVVIFGAVVLESDPTQGMPEARVNGWTLEGRGAFVKAVADADGAFEVERTPSEMLFHAMSKDGSFIGIARVGPDDRTCEIPMVRASSARGRLVDDTSGKPLAQHQIDFRLKTTALGGPIVFAVQAQNITTTDAEGNFEVNKLAPGWEYTLEVVIERDQQGNPRRWRTAGSVTPHRGKASELGDIKSVLADTPMISGKITFDGQPLAKGKVVLHPGQGEPVEAEVKDGEFSTAKVPLGELKVTLEFDGAPKKYESAKTTPLRVNIQKGKNPLAFDLKKE